jgi:hypothetical protein
MWGAVDPTTAVANLECEFSGNLFPPLRPPASLFLVLPPPFFPPLHSWLKIIGVSGGSIGCPIQPMEPLDPPHKHPYSTFVFFHIRPDRDPYILFCVLLSSFLWKCNICMGQRDQFANQQELSRSTCLKTLAQEREAFEPVQRLLSQDPIATVMFLSGRSIASICAHILSSRL